MNVECLLSYSLASRARGHVHAYHAIANRTPISTALRKRKNGSVSPIAEATIEPDVQDRAARGSPNDAAAGTEHQREERPSGSRWRRSHRDRE